MQVATGAIKSFPEGTTEEDMREKGYVKITEEEAKVLSKKSKPVRKNYMRNKPCPCGSKKKFKKCCWNKYI